MKSKSFSVSNDAMTLRGFDSIMQYQLTLFSNLRSLYVKNMSLSSKMSGSLKKTSPITVNLDAWKEGMDTSV